MPGPGPGPRPRPVYARYVVIQPRACKPVYNNQAKIDALNAILAGCDKAGQNGLSVCSDSFKSAVQKELNNQLNQAVYIGNDCSTPVYNTYPTAYRIARY